MPQNNINLAHPQLPGKLASQDGYTYTINPDFRVVLACLERLQDPDKTELDKAIYPRASFLFEGNAARYGAAVFRLCYRRTE